MISLFRIGFVSLVLFGALLLVMFPGSAAAAPILVQTNSFATGGNSTSITATYASQPTAGNLLVAILGNRSPAGSVTMPAGWSNIYQVPGFTPGISIVYKVAGVGEPTGVTFTVTSSTMLGLQIYEYSGIPNAVPHDATLNTGTGTSLSSSPVTTATNNELVVVGFTTNANTSFSSWTTSFTERNDFPNTGGSRSTYAGADLVAPTPGSYSTTATTTVSGAWTSVIVRFAGTDMCPGGVVTTTADSGASSLRECINYANANPGTTISFNIPLPANQSSGGNSWWRISPASTLPSLTAANTVIDGTTQTTNKGNTNSLGPEIELEGATSGINWGIVIQGGSSTIRGLVINRFNQMNITMPTGGNTIEGNYIGTNATGTATAGSSGTGISIGSGSSGNSIGGTTPTTRNVISGNSYGISLSGSGANNTVRGNYIGINAAGTAAIPNGTGLYVTMSSGNTFGGSGAGEGNVISGNTNNGIYMANDSNNNIFRGNTIGLDPTRTFAIPNGAIGIVVTGNAAPPHPTGNTFGGAAAGEGNVVSGNLGSGIEIRKGTGNTFLGNTIYGNGGNGVQATGGETNAILRNSIYGNSALGIDLNNDGVTANDGAKPAGTPNLLMDFPVFTSATLAGTTLTVAGYVGSAPNQATFAAARVEIFKSDNDGSGYGEGRTYLGFLTSDANGNFSGTLTVSGLAAGDKITGTATDGINNTSEFGANVTVASGGVSGTVFEDVNYGGGAGRSLAASSGVGRPNARVELFDGAGNYSTFATTDASGNYSFSGLASGSYTVRVVNGGVTSSRTGYVAGLWPLQTFRTDASSGTAVAVTDHVGGEVPGKEDAGNGTTTLAALTVGTRTAQSIAPVTIGASNVTGVDFGFNFDTIVNTNDARQGSLRQFLTNANTLAGDAGLAQAGRPAGIESAIFMLADGTARPGMNTGYASMFTGGVATIAPVSTLPTISTPMVIDGQKQPGWTSAPIVELNGAGAGAGVNGIAITAGGSTVRGLVVNRFNRSGILLSTAGNNTIAGNYIGANASGTASAANGAYGVEITGSTGNLVGGSTAAERNVISWNTLTGIYIDGSGVGNNTITGNYIGVDAAGAAAAPNSYGIWIFGTSGNTIGGSAASSRNVISGNTWSGIRIETGGSNNTIRGNYIGTNAAGNASRPNNLGINLMDSSGNTIGGTVAGEGNVISGNTNMGIQVAYNAANNVFQGNTIGLDPGRTVAIPNTSHGIAFAGSPSPSNNTVGGAAAGAGNVISGNLGSGIRIGSGTGNTIQANAIYGNGMDGVQVLAGTGNPILTNSIYGNSWIGIDLGNDNVTVNNGTKNAGLPNSDMDFPVFTSATLNGTTLTVAGYVGSAPGQATFANARVEIFKSDNDPSGYGEGRTYLGFLTANASGNFSGALTVGGLALGDKITGTATDGSNNTSEFGPNFIVAGIADLALTLTDNPDPAASGGDLLYTLLITNNGPDTATGVVATNVLPPGVTLQSATPSQGSCSGTTTVTCDLGAILNAGTASIEILVVTSGTGTITDNASVTALQSDPVPGNNTASATTQVVVGSGFGTPLSQYRRIHNFVDYTVTGGTLRTGSNNNNPCAVGASSTATLSGIPASATVVGAYLYWAGSGSTVDSQVTLNGTSLTADRTFTARYVLSPTNYDFFGGFKDVTAQVQATRNGNYTFSGLSVTTGNPYCASQAVLAGWSLIVIYQDNSLTGKTLVLYDGFDIERNGSTSYNLSGIFATTPPEGKATYLVWEGDPDLSGATERLTFNSNTLSDALNPANNPYNSTINSLGVSNSYGVDLDTFNVSGYVNGGDTLASTTVSVASDLVILNAVLLQVKSNVITGMVFEDVNYGGGAGRDLATAIAGAPGFNVPRPGAVVELYDAAGNFLRTTTTDASGRYGFSGLPDGDYTVRVPNDSVTSSRTGATGNEKAVQTYRADASSGSAVAVTNEVGGTNPAGQDAPANTTSQNLGSFFAQSKTPAKIITGIAVTNVDFGFNFDTIVNTNDSGQGSLRQFLTNANALGGDASLAQSGLVAAKENAVFMISNGTAAAGLRATNNYFTGGVATIAPASALPTISTPVVIDARKQPGWTSAPIIELNGTGAGGSVNGLTISAGSSTVRGLVINRFSLSGMLINTSGNNAIEGNYIGTNAAGTAPAPNGQQGIYVNGTSGNMIGGTAAGAGNLISGNGTLGVGVSGAVTGNAILGNSIYGNTGIGIDLGINGVTANDGAKTAGQPNLYMDFPVFTSAILSGSTLTVSGYVGSAPNQATFAGARVEIFKSDNDGSGYGEGRTYLGFLTADASGNFSGSLTVSGLSAGDKITGTATDGSSNTSEFGANAVVAAPGTQPDAMIKLASEGAGGYLTDNLYEAVATVQSKSQGVVSGSTAAYNVRFQNDGNVADALVISGTGNGSGFTVQYLDNTATDRTAAVTGAGYSIAGMAAGAMTVWTVNVTPAGSPTPVNGGTAYIVFVTAVSATDNTKIDQVKAVTTSTSANLTLVKSADKGTAAPGDDITYTVNASNGSGLTAAGSVFVTDPIPAYTGFKIGGATFNAGTSTLSFTVVYSNNGGSTWTYTPVTGGCSAPAGYDHCVTNVKWTTTGSMPTGTSFTVGLVVRVK